MTETMLSPLTPPDATADSYSRRLKRVQIPMRRMESLLTTDGQFALKVEGWPQNAKIVGAHVSRTPFNLTLYLYHPDFPVVLGEPPAIELRWNRLG